MTKLCQLSYFCTRHRNISKDKTICDCRLNYNITANLKTDHQKQSNFIVSISCDIIKTPRYKFFLPEGVRVSEILQMHWKH